MNLAAHERYLCRFGYNLRRAEGLAILRLCHEWALPMFVSLIGLWLGPRKKARRIVRLCRTWGATNANMVMIEVVHGDQLSCGCASSGCFRGRLGYAKGRGRRPRIDWLCLEWDASEAAKTRRPDWLREWGIVQLAMPGTSAIASRALPKG